MKYKFILASYIIFLFSCVNHKDKDDYQRQKVTNVENLSGNVFIFTELEPHDNIIYIIPVDEKDSAVFKKMNVVDAIQHKICIQLNTGCFSNFYKDEFKKIMAYKACNLPFNSMFYSRAFISYKNYSEVLIRPTDKNGKPIKLSQEDSCNTKVITSTDSSSFEIFHIYK